MIREIDRSMGRPIVSVLMTVFNREAFLPKAIDSVLSSTLPNFELIIVDDCSTDRSFEIVGKYAENDSRIFLFRNSVNLGDYKNRNEAARHARGKYLKYLDSDDVIYPQSLEILVSAMEKYPEAAFGVSTTPAKNLKPLPYLIEPIEAYRLFFKQNAFFSMGPSGSIIRRDIFKRENGFMEMPHVGDVELWLRLGAKYPLVRVQRDLFWWREHEDQQHKKSRTNLYRLEQTYKIYIEALNKPNCPLSLKDRKFFLYKLNKRYFLKALLALLKFDWTCGLGILQIVAIDIKSKIKIQH